MILVAVASGMAVAANALSPRGMVVGTNGFGTVRSAPLSPTGDVVSRRPNYRTVSEWYAQEEKLTPAEARKRLSEQQGFIPIFERLQERLRREENIRPSKCNGSSRNGRSASPRRSCLVS